MNNLPSDRRHFLKTAALAAIASPLGAIEPFNRTGRPLLRLALAAYSFRNRFIHFNRGKPGKMPGEENAIDMAAFVDYCAAHDCAAELTGYFFPDDADDAHFASIRRHAFLRGVPVSGTAVGNDFALPDGEKRDGQITYVKQWIDRAALMGAPHVRVFAGNAPKGTSETEARKLCVSALEECADYAGTKGIFLGIENHGGIVARAEGLLEIIHAVQSPWIGINLDTGNFHTEDPYGDLEKCAPYAVNVQAKIEVRAKGGKAEASDLSRVAAILRKANYQGFVALEYEASAAPEQAVPVWLEKLRTAIAG